MKAIRFLFTAGIMFAAAFTFSSCAGSPSGPQRNYEANEKAAINGGTFTDSRDNKTYKVVKIGSQVWMAENLNYEAKGSKCYGEGGLVYNEKTKNRDITLSKAEIQANCQKYGRFYDWNTAKTACPSGWHLPSTAEWNVLTAAVGGRETAGKTLKATSGWNNGGNGTDYYGFAALPGGVGGSNGSFFGDVGYSGNWWGASENHLFMDDDREDIDIMVYEAADDPDDVGIHDILLSVRCLQD